MAIVFALEKLYDDVAALFAAENTPITMSFGWREPAQQLVQPTHIDWVPGDAESGDFGKLQGPLYPGNNPRSLWAPRELFTVIIHAQDSTAPENERAQYHAARDAYDKWLRAIYIAAHGTIAIDSQRWIVARKERRYGASIRVVGAILAMTPDSANAVAPTDTKAHVTVTQGQQVETFDVEAP
jgi:hypothetical protein